MRAPRSRRFLDIRKSVLAGLICVFEVVNAARGRES